MCQSRDPQDEMHLRLDFLLVTCFRGNDYLPALACFRPKISDASLFHPSSPLPQEQLVSAGLKRNSFCNHLNNMLLFQHQHKVGNHQEKNKLQCAIGV